jgi:disulfide bond formation protein DsbB
MTTKNKILNIFDSIYILGITSVLSMAFYYQIFLHEIPCALCVFQRIALSLLTFGIILNLVHGNKSKHYLLVIIVALLNATMAATQILLHIVPGTGSYGDAVFSLHMYTWNFIISVIIILYASICGLISPNSSRKGQMMFITKAAIIVIIALTLANTISVFAECGINMCPSDPTSYWITSL